MRSRILAICGIIVGLLCGNLILFAAEESLPRYNLRVGRKLTYGVTMEMSDAGPSNRSKHSNKGTFTVTVLRENADGSRRVALRSAQTFTITNDGQSQAMPERVTIAYADVFPDGRSLSNPSLNMTIDPSTVLPLLPPDAAQLAQGWATPADAPQPSKYTMRAPGAADAASGTFVFVGEQTGVMNKVYEMTNRSTLHFDRAKGVVTRVTSEMGQGYGFKMKGTGETTLTADETVPAADVAALAADFDRLFDAQRAYMTGMQDLIRDPSTADMALESSKAQLTAARDASKTDTGRAEFDRMLKDHEQYAKYAKDEAERFTKVLNKPSPEWMSTDIDGNRAILADYRGKVVVLDFWYRGCGWCIYAMPQVMQLASDYKDKPVAVLGMNTDPKESDARFVIDTLGITYPTIKAEGIPPKYGIQGFPTLIVIDQAGFVRDIHVGYSPTLRDSVARKIDELLKEPPKAAG